MERWTVVALRNRTFLSLSEMNGAIRELLARPNARPCRALNASQREPSQRLD